MCVLYSLHNRLALLHKYTSTRRSSPISVTQSRVIPFAWRTENHYPTGLSAAQQLTTV